MTIKFQALIVCKSITAMPSYKLWTLGPLGFHSSLWLTITAAWMNLCYGVISFISDHYRPLFVYFACSVQ